MNSDDALPPVPRTRAEARALRALQEAQDAAAQGAAAHAGAAEIPAADAPTPEAAGPAVPDEPAAPAAEVPLPWHPNPPLADHPVQAGIEVPGTPAEPTPAPRRSRRAFALTLTAVLVVLGLVTAGLSYLSLTQGPRVVQVHADPAEAIALSGSRVILTTNQPLAEIDASQVSVTPAVPFTIDVAGRQVGVRFTVPLDDDTEYTVRVAGATGVGGGPAADLATTFTTPASEVYLLQRTDQDDTIFVTDLSGERAIPVFTHERINDFREAGDALVVVVEEEENSRVLVVGKDGVVRRDLTLPGDGYVSSVQVSDRGDLAGFIYSDRDLSETQGRASVLVTQTINTPSEPEIVTVAGSVASIGEWQFVPDSSSVVFIDFTGTLFVSDPTQDAEPSPMGLALSIQGLERGTYTAVIQRADGSLFRLNLADGSESDFSGLNPALGVTMGIVPFPGGTVQHVVARDENGIPIGQSAVRIDDDGTATVVMETGQSESIMQVCPSPSGQYLAVTLAPDLLNNAYDDLLLPVPQRTETHLYDLRSGEKLVALTGFDISWCAVAPIL